MEREEAKALAARLLAAFPGREVAEGTAALYVEYLEAFPAAVGHEAVTQLIESVRFIPAVAELVEALREESKQYMADRRKALEAGEKWEPTSEDREPLRQYLRKIGHLPPEVSDEEREREIAEKRERARSLSE